MTVPQKVYRICYLCGKIGHLAKACTPQKKESQGPFGRKSQRSGTKQVIGNTAFSEISKKEESLDPLK